MKIMFVVFTGLLFIIPIGIVIWFCSLEFIPKRTDKIKRRRVTFEDFSPRQRRYVLRRLKEKEKQRKETE